MRAADTSRMRILGLTNTYPPLAGGGYGEICADVMSGLARRGHEVRVLTCGEAFSADARTSADDLDGVAVERRLDYVLAPWRRPLAGLRAVARDAAIVRAELARGVDVAVVWHCRGVVKTSLRLLHEAGVPVLYQLHDRWVLYERPGSLYIPWARLDRLGARLPREWLGGLVAGRVELRAPQIAADGTVCFVSEWLAEEHTRRGWEPRRTEIVRCGVDVPAFARSAPPTIPPRELLFAGRIEPRKGLDTAIRALAELPGEVRLSIAGPVDDESYADRVRRLASELGVDRRISWLGEVPRPQVRELLGRHDVLVFPSTGVEAYALGLLEALAAGVFVVTSAHGGPREYLRDGSNALLFEPGDSGGLARALEALRGDADLCERLLAGAAATARELSIDAILDQVEGLVSEAAGAAGDGSS